MCRLRYETDLSVSVIYEGSHFTRRWKTNAWPHHVTKREVWAHKTSLIPQIVIEVLEPNQENERSCLCVLGVSIFPLSKILIFNFRIFPIGSDIL
jgi:hypothetical protein